MSKNGDVRGGWDRLPFGLRLHPDADVTRQYALSLLFLVIGMFLPAVTDEKTQFLYKETLHLSPSDVATLNLILGIPAYLAPLIAAGTELFPWFGYRRRPYFVLGVVVAFVGYVILSLLPRYAYTTVVPLLIVIVTGGTLRGIVVNAIMASVGNRTGILARLQSVMTLIGLILSLTMTARLSGFVSAHWSYHAVFLAGAILTACKFPLLFLMPDPRVGSALGDDTSRARERAETIQILRATWADKRFRAAIAMIAWIGLTPFPTSAQIYYESDYLHMSKQAIGLLDAWNSGGALAGLAVIYALGPRLKLRYAAPAFIGASVMGYIFFLLMRDAHTAPFCFAANGFTSVFATVMTAVLAARLCPKGAEGTVFAFMGAVSTLFVQLCDKWGTWLYDHYGPANTAAHYTVLHGWDVSLITGLVMGVMAFGFLPFLPLWTRSHAPLSTPVEEYVGAGPESAEPFDAAPVTPTAYARTPGEDGV